MISHGSPDELIAPGNNARTAFSGRALLQDCSGALKHDKKPIRGALAPRLGSLHAI